MTVAVDAVDVVDDARVARVRGRPADWVSREEGDAWRCGASDALRRLADDCPGTSGHASLSTGSPRFEPADVARASTAGAEPAENGCGRARASVSGGGGKGKPWAALDGEPVLS